MALHFAEVYETISQCKWFSFMSQVNDDSCISSKTGHAFNTMDVTQPKGPRLRTIL